MALASQRRHAIAQSQSQVRSGAHRSRKIQSAQQAKRRLALCAQVPKVKTVEAKVLRDAWTSAAANLMR